jgi:hypothetical protein
LAQQGAGKRGEMKQRVLKATLRIVNAVMAAGLVGMVCAMFAAGIGWGVGWVDDWRVPVRMFGGVMFALWLWLYGVTIF